MINPYKAPDAELTNSNFPQDGNNKFDRFGTWGVVGLSIITLSFYMVYWIYKRTLVLNRQPGITPIGGAFMIVASALYIISFLFIIPEVVYPQSQDVMLLSQLVSIFSNIFFLVWAFKYKNRLNVVLSNSGIPVKSIGSVMTFFFQVIYLSYKTNEYIDNLNVETQSARTNAAQIVG